MVLVAVVVRDMVRKEDEEENLGLWRWLGWNSKAGYNRPRAP